jgi:hypothetical protein
MHMAGPPTHGGDGSVMSGELMCCKELLAAYMRVEKYDRASHLLKCMLKCVHLVLLLGAVPIAV